MKKKYISPATEQISLFAEEAVMLNMSNGETNAIWSQEKNQGGWNSDDWSDLGDEAAE